MALFTAIAAAIGLTGFFATAFVTAASIATSIGLSYAARALSGNAQAPTAATDNFGVQGTLQSAGDVPRSFPLGYSVTAGSLVWANTWGAITPGGQSTPNAYLTQVIALADLPGGTLEGVIVNGELVTLGSTDTDPPYGRRVVEYVKEGQPYLWVQYYDGTQTTADPLCMNFAASAERPYPASRVGTGVAYVVVTSLVNETLFSGFPAFKFVLSGIKLYDPSKDSTNGGSGSHRYSNPATWGGDGDQLPAVQIYNVLRGFSYGGTWLYGLQNTTAARLPAINWNAQIAKCRATITGTAGAEPTYRSGMQINIDAQPANVVEAFLTACQGRLSEIGGFYKLHLGTPDSPTFSWTDDDLLTTEQQVFKPFFSLADSVNGIQATYPDPAQGWNTATAPAYYRTDLEILDGNRRLMASPAFDAVPYAAQVQRLQKSAIEEAQRARTHVLPFPPPFWLVEPGDVGEWTSTRNGYIAKLFRVDGAVDRANLDITLSVTEVDPTDYDWDHASEYVPGTVGSTIILRPAPQGVLDWFAEPATLYDADGVGRRPAIRLAWDGTVPGVDGVQYEVRLDVDDSHVTRGRTDQLAVGAIVVSQSLIPNTAYEVRGQYIPSAPRDMLWSDWLPVTTPDVRLSLLEFDAAVRAQVTTILDNVNDRLDFAEQKLASLASNDLATNWLDKKEQRRELHAVAGNAAADIIELQQVQVNDQAAFAAYQVTVSATFASVNANVTTNSTAISTLDGFAAASWSVAIDVGGNVIGLVLINDTNNISTFRVTANTFQVAFPGQPGGTAVPVFAISNVNGVAKLALRGDMLVDGQILTRMVAAGAITTVELAAGSVTAVKIVAGQIDSTKIAIGGVDILNLIAGAATNLDYFQFPAEGTVVGHPAFGSATMSTTIKSGKAFVTISGVVTPGSANDIYLYCDGSPVISWPLAAGTIPFSFSWVVGGLSVGLHTFSIGLSSASGITNSAGMIAVMDLRR